MVDAKIYPEILINEQSDRIISCIYPSCNINYPEDDWKSGYVLIQSIIAPSYKHS